MQVGVISNDIKLQVVQDWLTYGSLKRAAELNEQNYTTVKEWHQKAKWWKEYEDAVMAERRQGEMGTIQRVVEKGLVEIEDRLEAGELKVNPRTGAVERRPASLRDVAAATNGLMQRKHQLEKQQLEHGNREQTKSITEQLTFLAEQFAKFNNRHKTEAVDVDFKELSYEENQLAIYEDRQREVSS